MSDGPRGRLRPTLPEFGKLQIPMAWFKKARTPIAATKEKPSRVPEGSVGEVSRLLADHLQQGPDDQPERLPEVRASLPRQRDRTAADALRRRRPGSSTTRASSPPIRCSFTDTKPYRQRLEVSVKATGIKEGVIVGSGRLDGIETVIAAQEYGFIAGSMGVVVGEKLTRGIERAIERRCPVVIVCCSGGARMMEGALSLMQMAKVSGALARLDRAAPALHRGADRSDHRRGHGELRHAGRPEHRRAEGADRVRRSARHRTDHPAEASRRAFSAASSCSTRACST